MSLLSHKGMSVLSLCQGWRNRITQNIDKKGLPDIAFFANFCEDANGQKPLFLLFEETYQLPLSERVELTD